MANSWQFVFLKKIFSTKLERKSKQFFRISSTIFPEHTAYFPVSTDRIIESQALIYYSVPLIRYSQALNI